MGDSLYVIFIKSEIGYSTLFKPVITSINSPSNKTLDTLLSNKHPSLIKKTIPISDSFSSQELRTKAQGIIDLL